MLNLEVLGHYLANLSTGRFITVEGGEGVGKTSFVKGLTKELKSLAIPLVQTHEPGGTPVAEKLRELFLNPPGNDPLQIETEFCIVSAARAQHVAKVIKPALAKGQWVLCDRFADSSRVYQGYLAGISEQDIEAVIKLTTFNLQPDITFLLDCDTETSLKRIAERNQHSDQEQTRFDNGKKAMHNKIKAYFLKLKTRFPDRICVIDTKKPLEEVVRIAIHEIKQKYL